MAAMASSRGSTPLMAKKQVCITVLMRPPMPASFATLTASITKKRSFFSMICRLRGARHHVPDFVRSVGAVQQESGAGFGGLEHVEPLKERELVAGHEIRLAKSGRWSESAWGRSAGGKW